MLALLALAAFAAAFEIGKAAHIDDGAHLGIARAILRSPLHPMSALFNWDQVRQPVHLLNQPHLLFYLIAGAIAVAGQNDVLLHALWAAFTCGAVLLCWRFARAVVPDRALVATALVALGPALLPSQNLMVDVPLLALWLGFFACMLEESAAADWVACGFAAAGCLVKYNSVLLLPAFVVLVARGKRWRSLWALSLPLAALAGWSALNLYDYGGIHLLERRPGSGAAGEGPAIIASLMAARLPLWFVGLGAAAPFAPFVAAGLWHLPSERRWILACCAIGAAIAVAGLLLPMPDLPPCRGLTPVDAVLRGAFFGNGLLLARLVTGALQRQAMGTRRDALVLGLLSAFATAVILAPFPAMRHVLLAMPFAVLAMLRDPALRLRPGRARAALAATAVVGCAVALADLQWADIYRREAAALAQANSGRTVWYLGHWGWEVYASANGMRAYEPGQSVLGEGDVVVVPELVHQQALTADDQRRLSLLREEVVPASAWNWLRTVTAAGGFYYYWGAVPWTLRRGPRERFRVYSVHLGYPVILAQ